MREDKSFFLPEKQSFWWTYKDDHISHQFEVVVSKINYHIKIIFCQKWICHRFQSEAHIQDIPLGTHNIYWKVQMCYKCHFKMYGTSFWTVRNVLFFEFQLFEPRLDLPKELSCTWASLKNLFQVFNPWNDHN